MSKTPNKAASLSSVTSKSLALHIKMNMLAGTTTYIAGPPGSGKTDIVRQAAINMEYTPVQFIASEMLPEDMGGIPVADYEAKVVRRLMPDVVARISDARQQGKPVLAFFDEINNGAQSVMASCFKLLHEGEAGGYKVPPDTRFVAAGNPPDTSSVAQELPAPLLNRFANVSYTGPTFHEWEEYAVTHGVHPAVIGFISSQRNYLNDKADFNSGNSTPTPRSWMEASKKLHLYDIIGKDTATSTVLRDVDVALVKKLVGEDVKISRAFRMEAIASHVGTEAAHMIESSILMADKLVPWETILREPETAPVTQEFVPAYMQAVSLVSSIRHKNTEDLKAAMKYAMRMPREVMGIIGIGITKRQDGAELTMALTMEQMRSFRDINGGVDIRINYNR